MILLLLSENIERLQKNLIKEEYLAFIFKAIDNSNITRDTALISIEQCILYSLHIDLRKTEKFIKILL